MKSQNFAKQLMSKLTLEEKVAQLSQTVAGYRCYKRQGDTFTFSEDLETFVRDYGAMGAISNILRSCSFTQKPWGVGVEPQHRVKVANQLQQYILDHARVPIPVLIEVEANHGVQALGSELFPTNIGMGSAFNSELYGQIMRSVGKEIRLSGNHMGFTTMFDLARDPRWGRVEEFFSEDPYLAASYAAEGVAAYKAEGILSCCKHYCGTGDSLGGINQAEVSIGERELRDIYLPVVRAAVANGADVVMAAYNAMDGIPCHANKWLLRDILRDELGFEGVVLSDGWGVKQTVNWLGLNDVDGSARVLHSGVDLSLADDGMFLNLIKAVRAGKVNEELIDAAVLRILTKKYEIGLFDHPFTQDEGQVAAYLTSGEQKQLSYQMACESMVLVKNNGALPFDRMKKVALIGETAFDQYNLLGDYTSFRKEGECKSILEAFREKFPQMQYAMGCHFEKCNIADHEAALAVARDADIIVMTMGGSSARISTDVKFDQHMGGALASKGFIDCGEFYDVASLKLPGDQIELLHKMRELGKPIVSVMVQGRPYLLDEVEELSDAVLIAWYPGQQGGDALVDILTGKVNPSGKLSVSIPHADGTLPAWYNSLDDNPYCYRNHWGKRVLHPFGYGLSYSTFAYSDLVVQEISPNHFAIAVNVTNTSSADGQEVVQLYIHGRGNSIRRRVKELRGYEKVFLHAGEMKTVTFCLGYEELRIWSAMNRYEVEEAEVDIMVGSNPELPLRASIHTHAEMR